jgi:hypothetical protein
MKKILLAILILFGTYAGFSQHSFEWTPYLQLTGTYYTSDEVTFDGVGPGAGIVAVVDRHYIAQADMNLLWLNGNAVSNRFAIGYQKKGTWTPAILATFNLLWGSRTEIVNESGERPSSPTWVLGVRIVPLKFELPSGFVSVLEFGYGRGPSKGYCLEATLLSVGITF